MSLALGGFCIYIALGTALSDAYHPYPPILRIGEALLFALQFPAAILYWLTARSGATTWNLAVGLALAASWSISLGFILRWLGRRIQKTLSTHRT